MYQDRSKQYYKRKLRNFWKKQWIHGRSPERWVASIHPIMRHAIEKNKILLKNALHKLELEKKIDEKQRHNLWSMIESPDKENALLALSIMQSLNPRVFRRKGDPVEPGFPVPSNDIIPGYNMRNGATVHGTNTYP